MSKHTNNIVIKATQTKEILLRINLLKDIYRDNNLKFSDLKFNIPIYYKILIGNICILIIAFKVKLLKVKNIKFLIIALFPMQRMNSSE